MFHPEGIPPGSALSPNLVWPFFLTFYLSSLAFPFLFPDFFPLTIPLRSRERMQRTGIFGDDSGNNLDFFVVSFFSFPWGNISQTICAPGSDPLWKKVRRNGWNFVVVWLSGRPRLVSLLAFGVEAVCDRGPRPICVCVCNSKIERTGGNGSGRVPPIYPACAVMYTHAVGRRWYISENGISCLCVKDGPMRKRPNQLVVV